MDEYDYTPTTADIKDYWANDEAGEARFERWLLKLKIEIWDEGEEDGRWNEGHSGAIAYGTRKAIKNPYRGVDNE